MVGRTPANLPKFDSSPQIDTSTSEGTPGTVPSPVTTKGTVEGVAVGCFPDLYAALAGSPPDYRLRMTPINTRPALWPTPDAE